MTENIEQAILWITASISVVVSLIDFLGLLDKFSERIPTLNLLLLGMVSIYLVLERRNRLLKIEKNIASFERKYSQTDLFFNSLLSEDHFSELLLVYGIKPFSKVVKENKILINKENIFNFWRDSILKADRWFAVTYVKQEEVWDMGWGEKIAHNIQAARIKGGATIKRVFLVENNGEAKNLEKIMEAQKDIGVEVRWIKIDDITQVKTILNYLKAIGTNDFAIVDDSWVSRIYLDKKRNYSGADAIKDNDILIKARFVFNEAFAKGSQ